MNRKQRRAAQKQSPPAARRPLASAPANVQEMFERATAHHKRGELDAAAQLYKQVLTLKPDHAMACDALGLVYLMQGQRAQAAAQYAELARLAPQTLIQFTKVVEILKQLNPGLAAAFSRPAPAALTSQDVSAIAADPYFRAVLESTPVRDIALERLLTSLRAEILAAALAGEQVSADVLAFYGALAQQCFINEYVFAAAPGELEQVEKLKAILADALARGAPVAPLQLIVLAMYVPLHTLPGAQALTKREWPAPVAAVVTQQVRDQLAEQDATRHHPAPHRDWRRRHRAGAPAIRGEPLPALGAHGGAARPADGARRSSPPPVPHASYRAVGKRDGLDILVAGCGTGRNALELAQTLRSPHVLGVDISLASLANAKRHTPPALAGMVEFAQGDILSLGSIGRDFDLIVVGGVLHHMEEPLAGWRELLKLMRPNALMQVGLYSAHARRDIVAARAMIAERGYRSTPDDIRRCRQDLIDGPENFKFMALNDFFTVSECRDLLFHVHERQFTIPEIKAFIEA